MQPVSFPLVSGESYLIVILSVYLPEDPRGWAGLFGHLIGLVRAQWDCGLTRGLRLHGVRRAWPDGWARYSQPVLARKSSEDYL